MQNMKACNYVIYLIVRKAYTRKCNLSMKEYIIY